jgi:hypothetical protein
MSFWRYSRKAFNVSSNGPIFIPIVTSEERSDKSSWVHTGYEFPHDQYEDICRLVGEAIFAWGQVENNLFAVYAKSIQSKPIRGAQANWEALDSFRAKREMTNRVHSVSGLVGMDVNVWERLSDRARKKSLRRNNIAHGQLYYAHTEKNVSRKFFIATPSIVDGIDRRDYASDLRSLRAAFQKLSDDIFTYWITLKAE